jgi:ferredoxin
MADSSDRNPTNIAGRYYVDSSCIDCDLCRSTAPGVFRRDDELGLSIVFRQPRNAEEIEAAEEALSSCPTNSIGNDGPAASEPSAEDEAENNTAA